MQDDVIFLIVYSLVICVLLIFLVQAVKREARQEQKDYEHNEKVIAFLVSQREEEVARKNSDWLKRQREQLFSERCSN